MMDFLLIDVGNTNIKFATMTGGQLSEVYATSSTNQSTVDDYFMFCKTFVTQYVHKVAIASVVPNITSKIINMCHKHLKHLGDPIILSDSDSNLTNITIPVNHLPFGVDRCASLLAATTLFPKRDLLIIGSGTVTTFAVLDHNATLRGQVIAPGFMTFVHGLRNSTAQLPQSNLNLDLNYVVGNSLSTGMSAGIYWGYISMLEGIVNKIKSQFSEKLYTIMYGGNSLHLLEQHTQHFIDIRIVHLVMKGIAQLACLRCV